MSFAQRVRSLVRRLGARSPLSLAGRLLAAAFVFLAGFTLLAGSLTYVLAYRLHEHDMRRELEGHAAALSERVKQRLTDVLERLAMVADAPPIGASLLDTRESDKHLIALLREQRVSSLAGAGLCVTDFSGSTIACDRQPNAVFRGAKWLEPVIGRGQTYAEVVKQDGEAWLLLVVPVRYPFTSSAEGAVTATIPLQRLMGQETQLLESRFQSTLKTSERPVLGAAQPVRSRLQVERAVDAGAPFDQINLSIVLTPTGTIQAPALSSLAWIYLSVCAVLGSLALWGVRGRWGRVFRPLALLAEQIERAAVDGEPAPLALPETSGELRRVAAGVDRLIGRVREAHQDIERRVEARTAELNDARRVLQESEERLRNALAGSNEGHWEWQVDTGEALFSSRCRQLLGMPDDEEGGRWEDWLGRLHAEDLPRLQAELERHLSGDTDHFQCEPRLRCRDGQYKWILLRGMLVGSARPGSPRRVVGTFADVSQRKILEHWLRESERQYRAIFESSADALLLVSRAGYILDANRAACQTYQREKVELLGVHARVLVHPDHRSGLATLAGAAARVGSFTVESVHTRKNGEDFHVELTVTCFSLGEEKALLCVARDISERKASEEKLRMAGLVFDRSSQGILLTDHQNRILLVNPAFEDITGYRAADVLGHDPKLLKSGMQDKEFYGAMWRELRQRGVWQGELWNRKKNGELYAQRVSIAAIRDTNGSVRQYLGMFSDISLQKRQAERIKHLADHDELTGLPNRRLFMDRLEQALALASRDASGAGVLMLDLDGFKQVNDTMGHKAGDLLLIQAGKRLRHCVRESDTVARLGGDEFTVLLQELGHQHDAQVVAAKILESIQQPFSIEGAEVYVSASIGIALFGEDGSDAGELLKNADTAMYRAKAEGKNAYRFFTREMQAQAVARMTLENDLRRAVLDREFVVHYQPIVDLGTREVVKAEALLRWDSPQRGLVGPADFVPLAEETGAIVAIGEWVIREVMEQIGRWQSRMAPEFRVSINLSAQQCRRGHLTDVLASAMEASSVRPDRIVLEITESLFMDDAGQARAKLRRMREEGVRIAIDDFGTGYSSLSYLKKFAIDVLKIDRSFVHYVPSDAEGTALVEAILNMSRSLGIEVIAEGVEREDQLDFLRVRGCRYAQGYLFGRPVPAAEFESLYLRSAPQSGVPRSAIGL